MSHRSQIFLLWLLTTVFLSRVIGQILVGIYAPPSLPPWREWYSGLMPYPWLLLSQILLLMFMAVVNTDQARQSGRFCVTSGKARHRLRVFAGLYGLSMVVRYAARMIFVPEARWFGGTIPIWFHLGLAAWLWILTTQFRNKT